MSVAIAVAASAVVLGSACGSGSDAHRVPPKYTGGSGGTMELAGAGGRGGSAGRGGNGGTTPNGEGGLLVVGGAPSQGGEAGQGGANPAAGAANEAGAGGEAGAPCGDGALSFSGAQFVQIPGTESLDLKTGLTLEAWLKTSTPVAVETLFFAKHACGTDNGYFLEIYSNSLDGAHGPNVPSFYVSANTNHVYGTTSIIDGKWHHVAGTWDGATSRLYVDGVFVGSKAVSAMKTNTVDLFLGAATDGSCRPYTGLLDEVSVWSVARTAQQIAADALAPVSKTAPNLEAYFDFNGGSCGKTLADRSAHGRNGLLGGSAAPSEHDPTWVSDGPF